MLCCVLKGLILATDLFLLPEESQDVVLIINFVVRIYFNARDILTVPYTLVT